MDGARPSTAEDCVYHCGMYVLIRHHGTSSSLQRQMYFLTGTALTLGIRTLLCQRRCRQNFEDEPSKREAIFAAYKKEMVVANRQQFKVSLLFSGFALIIWKVDAAIGGLAIYKDFSSLGSNTAARFWLELALQMISILAILVLFMAAVPMAQIAGFSFWIQHRHKGTANGSEDIMAAIASEASILSTHFMQLWVSRMGILPSYIIDIS